MCACVFVPINAGVFLALLKGTHVPTPRRLASGLADPGAPERSHPAAMRGPNYSPGIIQSRPPASCQGLPLTPQCCFRVGSGDPNSMTCTCTQRPRPGLWATSLGAVVVRARIAPCITGLPDSVESFLDPRIPQDEGVLFKGDKGALGQFGILGFGV